MSRTPYRVAIRAEGEWINAYWARTGTMEGAIEIARISRKLCEAMPEAWEAFQLLTQMASIHLVKQATGLTPTDIEITDAPEHERAGRG